MSALGGVDSFPAALVLQRNCSGNFGDEENPVLLPNHRGRCPEWGSRSGELQVGTCGSRGGQGAAGCPRRPRPRPSPRCPCVPPCLPPAGRPATAWGAAGPLEDTGRGGEGWPGRGWHRERRVRPVDGSERGGGGADGHRDRALPRGAELPRSAGVPSELRPFPPSRHVT